MNVACSPPSTTAWTDRKRPFTGIWLAVALALLLHFIFLLLPILDKAELTPQLDRNIEVQVSRYVPEPAVEPPLEMPVEPPLESPIPIEQNPELVQPPVETPLPQPSTKPLSPTPNTVETSPSDIELPLPVRAADQVSDNKMQPLQKLTPSILSSQFISEESASDKIFGPSLQPDPQPARKDFHFPQQPNMITMLNKPVADLPFAYTPGLVQFAYEPGVKGDFQRFFDKITPEFGWKSNYGTQYKCKWILVIATCGWGRIKDHVKDHSGESAQFLKPDQPEGSE